ncbi:MAG: hypothetical protein RLZ25_1509 [Pseudomonadota bacterium]|jgi:hypothetical protein
MKSKWAIGFEWVVTAAAVITVIILVFLGSDSAAVSNLI